MLRVPWEARTSAASPHPHGRLGLGIGTAPAGHGSLVGALATLALRVLAAAFLLPTLASAQVLDTALPVNPTSLDPHRAIEGYSFMVTNQVYDTLVRLGEGGEIVPGLAEAWSWPEPGVLRLRLRQGVRFHDGSPLDAPTVAASLRRLVDPATASRGAFLLAAVDRFEVLDDHTLDLVSEPPHTPLLANLTFPATAIVPLGANDDLAREPVGTGPFRFVSWRDGDVIELVRDPGYWGGPPPLKRVRFRVIPESAARLIAFRAGDLHLIHDLPPDAFASLTGEPAVERVTYASDRTSYLEFNLRHPLLRDVRVRRAIAHALDRTLLTEAVFGGLALPPRGLLSPLVRYALDEPDAYGYDPELARASLRQAGVEGARLRLDIGADGNLEVVAQYVQAALAEVGIEVEIRRSDFATYYELLASGQGELSLGYWGSDTLDPDFMLGLALHGSQIGGNNSAGYQQPEFDALLERGARLPDGPDRAAAYRDAQERALADLPMLPLYHHVGTYAKRGGLEGERVVASSFQLDLRDARLPADAGTP